MADRRVLGSLSVGTVFRFFESDIDAYVLVHNDPGIGTGSLSIAYEPANDRGQQQRQWCSAGKSVYPEPESVDTRVFMLRVRLTEPERIQLAERAAAVGLDMSEYTRRRLFSIEQPARGE